MLYQSSLWEESAAFILLYVQEADEEGESGPRRVHHSTMASRRSKMISEVAQGKRPGGQIMLKFDVELRAMKLSVSKNTTYSLQALKSKVGSQRRDLKF